MINISKLFIGIVITFRVFFVINMCCEIQFAFIGIYFIKCFLPIILSLNLSIFTSCRETGDCRMTRSVSHFVFFIHLFHVVFFRVFLRYNHKLSLKTSWTVQLYLQFGAEQLMLYTCTVTTSKLELDNVSANQRRVYYHVTSLELWLVWRISAVVCVCVCESDLNL